MQLSIHKSIRNMSQHAYAIRSSLFSGLLSARQLSEKIGISQPTLSRSLATLGNEIVRIGAARSIQYALRDTARGLPEIPVYRVSTEGTLKKLGTLTPVCPEGFVMHQEDGNTLHSDSMPWWLLDMLPQGYLGRAYAAKHGTSLGLNSKLNNWSDTDHIRALLAHGYDVVGNLLLGDTTRNHFINAPDPHLITEEQKPQTYARLALEAVRGDIPGSSAGGEQPKFTAYAMTPNGAQHVIVKFSELDENPVTERWRDLLYAEHIALNTLREGGVSSAKTYVIDNDYQRFLEVARFDRIGKLGRRAVHSLKSLDLEFVGNATESWPVIVRELDKGGKILPEAVNEASLLWAFGTLIGNTDMHNSNLSFIAESGQPYTLAPAYDMTPMAFSPRSGGGLPASLAEPNITAAIDSDIWRRAIALATEFLSKVNSTSAFSEGFEPCITALAQHIERGKVKIAKLD